MFPSAAETALLYLLVVSTAQGQRTAGIEAQSISSLLGLSTPSQVLGSDASGAEDLFGLIVGAALGPDSRIYILDASEKRVVVFDSAGKHLAFVGQQGRGPGDLSDPRAIAHGPNTLLYVADLINGVNVFDTQSVPPRFLRRVAEGLRPTDVCTLGDHVVVFGRHDGRLLHVLNGDGGIAASLGEEFVGPDSSGMVRMTLNSFGRIACDAEQGMVYVTPVSFDEVRAYDLSGRLRWLAKLPQYKGTRFVPSQRGPGYTMVLGEYMTARLHVLDGLLLVQVRRTGASGGRSEGIVTYLLDAATGALKAFGDGAPMVGDSRGRVIVAFIDEPTPRALVFR